MWCKLVESLDLIFGHDGSFSFGVNEMQGKLGGDLAQPSASSSTTHSGGIREGELHRTRRLADATKKIPQLLVLTASFLGLVFSATPPPSTSLSPCARYESNTLGSHCLKKFFFKNIPFASSRLFHPSRLAAAPPASCAQLTSPDGSTGSQRMTEEKREGTALQAKVRLVPPAECPIPTIRRPLKTREEGEGSPEGWASVSRARWVDEAGHVGSLLGGGVRDGEGR